MQSDSRGAGKLKLNQLALVGLGGLLVLANLPAASPALSQEPAATPPASVGAVIDKALEGEAAPPATTAPVATAPAPDPVPPLVLPFSAQQQSELFQALVESPSHGLGDYLDEIDAIQALEADGNIQEANQRLTDLALSYARDIRSGQLSPSQFRTEWGLKPTAFDPAPGLKAAVESNSLKPWLDGLPPRYAGYSTLRRGLAKYQDIKASGGWRSVPTGPDLALGATGARVEQLRQRLAAEDPLVVRTGAVFDADLKAAVIRAQRRFGLAPTGVVSTGTLAALNTSIDERIGQIVANMERWRWLPPTMPKDRIQVNVAAAVLSLFRGDAAVMSMKAVTGKPGGMETPLLTSSIHSIVLNPPWNVPSGIAAKELWPKERARPGYFKANDFVVIKLDGGGTRLQQQPGPKAALGRYKFDFANSYSVYLHDTPSRGSFGGYGRLGSHGCVRVEKPNELAKALLEGDPAWTPEVLDAAVASKKTQRVPVAKPVTVFLLYWTAYVTSDGQVNYRQDPYGWDRDLIQRLDKDAA